MTRRKSRLFRPYIPRSVNAPREPHIDCACASCVEWRHTKVFPGALARVFSPSSLYDGGRRQLRMPGASNCVVRFVKHDDLVLVIGHEHNNRTVVQHLSSGNIGTLNRGSLTIV